MERLEHLAAQFNHKASNLEAWMARKSDMLSQREDLEETNLDEAMVITLHLYVLQHTYMLYVHAGFVDITQST